MAGRAKKDRNDLIKKLFLVDHIAQPVIGKMFGIGQSRVSCIVHDILPQYRYCTFCDTRLYSSAAVCNTCKDKNAVERGNKRDAKRDYRELIKMCNKDARRILKNLRIDLIHQKKETALIEKKALSFIRPQYLIRAPNGITLI